MDNQIDSAFKRLLKNRCCPAVVDYRYDVSGFCQRRDSAEVLLFKQQGCRAFEKEKFGTGQGIFDCEKVSAVNEVRRDPEPGTD